MGTDSFDQVSLGNLRELEASIPYSPCGGNSTCPRPTNLLSEWQEREARTSTGFVPPTRVLVADGHAGDRKLLGNLLSRWNYQVDFLTNGDEAWNALQQPSSPRLALLDWKMPGLSGVDVCRKLREFRNDPYTYVILVSARVERQAVVEGFRAGADDFICKPFEARELKARLEAAHGKLTTQYKSAAALEELLFASSHDSLTRLLNRRTIEEALRRELSRRERSCSSLTALLIDLDHFKQVNDTYGHPAGDEVLRSAAARISETARPYDFVGRYGGEEFMVVAPECTTIGAVALADRIRRHIAVQPIKYGGTEIPLTASIGLAVASEATPLDAEGLIASADQALYAAKRSGRDRIELARGLVAVSSFHDESCRTELAHRFRVPKYKFMAWSSTDGCH